jgi:hypothetical protein
MVSVDCAPRNAEDARSGGASGKGCAENLACTSTSISEPRAESVRFVELLYPRCDTESAGDVRRDFDGTSRRGKWWAVQGSNLRHNLLIPRAVPFTQHSRGHQTGLICAVLAACHYRSTSTLIVELTTQCAKMRRCPLELRGTPDRRLFRAKGQTSSLSGLIG